MEENGLDAGLFNPMGMCVNAVDDVDLRGDRLRMNYNVIIGSMVAVMAMLGGTGGW